MMKIYYNDTYTEVIPTDDSYRYREIMGDNLINLSFSLTEFIDFPIGSYVIFQGNKYSLYEIGNFTKINNRNYSYTLQFHARQKELEKYKFRNTIDRRLKFTITARPAEFVKHIVDNLNERDTDTTDGTWLVGDCIDAGEKTQSFSHNSIREALDSVANLFETEWEIVGKTISVRKLDRNKANALELAYGKGNGFKSGISRNLGSESACDILFCIGGEHNIDSSKYFKKEDGTTENSNFLRLPRNETFYYFPPTETEIEKPDNKDYGTIYTELTFHQLPQRVWQSLQYKAMIFKSDEHGLELRRCKLENGEVVEGFIANGYEESLDLSEIYPHRQGTLTEDAICVDEKSHFWDFVDMDNDVDYSDKFMYESGATVTIIFQTGMLTGKEFNLAHYQHTLKEEGSDNLRPIRRFEIQPAEIDGITMPDKPSGYYPKKGDKYAIFHINMPQQYVGDAELEMARQGCYYMYQHTETEIEFQGEVDGIWAKKNWPEISGKIGLGYYIKFKDDAICSDGKLMRITAIKDLIGNPHSPELTLSNSSVSQGISSQIKKIAQNEVYTEKLNSDTIAFAKRNFRDTKETLELLNNNVENLSEALDSNYTESISPIAAQMMMLLVGDGNLQYDFGSVSYADSKLVFSTELYEPSFNAGFLSLPDTYLQHYNWGTETMRPTWKVVAEGDEKGIWIDAENKDKPYFLYVKANKAATSSANWGKVYGEAARFVLSETALTATDNYLYFLVGVLNSENGGNRSFASCHGKTEISGDRISTGIIKSEDGSTYFDLKNNVIVGNIQFKDGLISSGVMIGESKDKAIGGFGRTVDGNVEAFWIGKKADNMWFSNFHTFAIDSEGTIYTNSAIYADRLTLDGGLTSRWFDATANGIFAYADFKAQGKFVAEKGMWGVYNNFRGPVPMLMWNGRIYYSREYKVWGWQVTSDNLAHYNIQGHTETFNISKIVIIRTGYIEVWFNYTFASADDYFVTAISHFHKESGDSDSDTDNGFVTIDGKDPSFLRIRTANDNTTDNLSFDLQIWALGHSY